MILYSGVIHGGSSLQARGVPKYWGSLARRCSGFYRSGGGAFGGPGEVWHSVRGAWGVVIRRAVERPRDGGTVWRWVWPNRVHDGSLKLFSSNFY